MSGKKGFYNAGLLLATLLLAGCGYKETVSVDVAKKTVTAEAEVYFNEEEYQSLAEMSDGNTNDSELTKVTVDGKTYYKSSEKEVLKASDLKSNSITLDDHAYVQYINRSAMDLTAGGKNDALVPEFAELTYHFSRNVVDTNGTLLSDGKSVSLDVTKLKEVNAAIREIIGLDRGQFSQVSMIAQGDFLKLLLAGTRERQEIFRSIFNTNLYVVLQKKLSEDANAVRSQWDDTRLSIRQYVDGIVCEPDTPLADAGDLPISEVAELLDRSLAEDEALQQQLGEQLSAVEKALEDAAAQMTKAEQRGKTVAALKAAEDAEKAAAALLEQRQAALEAERARKPEQDALQKKITELELLLPSYDELEKLIAQQAQASAELEQAASGAAKAQQEHAALLEALEQAKEPTIPELLSRYLDKRSEERTGWTSKGKLKGTVGDFNKVMEALDFLRQKEISTVESLDAYLDEASAQAVSIREEIRPMEKRVKEIDRLLFHIGNFEANKPVHAKYAAIRWKKPKEKFAADHKEELDAYNAALRYFKVHLDGAKYSTKKLAGEQAQLSENIASKTEALTAVQEDVKILRDVRHWLNQVLPSEQYRQTAEPGKKPSIQQAVKGREQRIREEQAEKHQQPRRQQKQDMEL